MQEGWFGKAQILIEIEEERKCYKGGFGIFLVSASWANIHFLKQAVDEVINFYNFGHFRGFVEWLLKFC